MARKWRIIKRIISACILVLAIISFSILFLGTPVRAVNAFEIIRNVIEPILEIFNPPLEITAPDGRDKGGAGRGPQCPSVDIQLTALVPSDEFQGEASGAIPVEYVWVYGKTVEEQPTFWFYVPYDSENVKTAKFTLLDANSYYVRDPVLKKPIEPIEITLAETPGIIKFRLPYKLEIDKPYNWYFSIICDPQKPSRNPGVKGWIQRVEQSPDLLKDLDALPPVRKYLAYAERGIWFDLITNLAESYRTHQGDKTLRIEWTQLLNFFHLSELAQEPIVNCCTAESKDK